MVRQTKRQYVIGFSGEDQSVVYDGKTNREGMRYVEKLTRDEAVKALETLQTGVPKTIFKLVPVKP